MKEQIAHIGLDERILFQGKDFSKDYESLAPFNAFKSMQVEEIIPVSEQVRNVLNEKDDNVEEKIMGIISQRYRLKNLANFQEHHINKSYNSEYTNERYPIEVIEASKSPSVNKLLFSGFKWTSKNEKIIAKII